MIKKIIDRLSTHYQPSYGFSLIKVFFSNYVKFQIEHSKKIKKELILNQDDFIINAVSVTKIVKIKID